MNAARRAREAERVAIFWDLVEERGLTLEELTTRVRRDLVGQAKWIQQAVLDRVEELARAKTTPAAAPEAATVVTAPVRARRTPVRARTEPGRGAHACAFAVGREWARMLK